VEKLYKCFVCATEDSECGHV